jgi:membrane protein YqaA with SNARE-associated domain
LISVLEAYAGLALSAFLAATILPVSSEAVLASLTLGSDQNIWVLWLIASTANTLGSMVNWWLGRSCLRYSRRRWFPFSSAAMEAAGQRFRRWGQWSLLLAWVPIVGDPLTFTAGVMATDWRLTIILLATGKAARYGIVIAAAVQFT